MAFFIRFSIILIFCFVTISSVYAKDENCYSLMRTILLSKSSKDPSNINFPKSDKYEYKHISDDQVAITWNDATLREFQKKCQKYDFREKIENEISRLEKFDRLEGVSRTSWGFREIIVEIMNRKVIPGFGIVEIKFSNPPKPEDPVAITVDLKSVCGYTVSYNIQSDTWIAKGARIK